MDRRQRKTRAAIFRGFAELLTKKEFNKITVEQIITAADVGRATFYTHFETKDDLLKEFCEELFCHIFDAEKGNSLNHRHIFDCDSPQPAFLHLTQHLQNNDHNMLTLLSSQNNELFLQYFRVNLAQLVQAHIDLFAQKKDPCLPDTFWVDHIVCTFVDTIRWWIQNGTRESPEVITDYFFKVV